MIKVISLPQPNLEVQTRLSRHILPRDPFGPRKPRVKSDFFKHSLSPYTTFYTADVNILVVFVWKEQKNKLGLIFVIERDAEMMRLLLIKLTFVKYLPHNKVLLILHAVGKTISYNITIVGILKRVFFFVKRHRNIVDFLKLYMY